MRIKSYYADTIEDAMDKARIELGPDAMLMNSRRSAPEASHLGAYEVVFALDQGQPAHRLRAAVDEHMATAKPPSALNDALATEIAELKRQIEGVKQSVSRQTVRLRWSHGASAEASELYSRLVQAGFTDDTAQELVGSVQLRTEGAFAAGAPRPEGDEPAASLETMTRLLEQELRQRLRLSSGLGRGPERRTVMLVGAPGAGKTATLAKLAIRCGLEARSPVQLISADGWRVGTSEQLRAYAAILGVGFEVADSMPALEHAVHMHAGKTVLIDTPGFGVNDTEVADELAQFCRKHDEIEVQLVLPAHTRGAVLSRTFDRFSAFRPSRMIATFLDETDLMGAVVEQGIRAAIPFSFTTCGQQVPEDIRPADYETFLGPILEGLPRAAAIAAPGGYGR